MQIRVLVLQTCLSGRAELSSEGGAENNKQANLVNTEELKQQDKCQCGFHPFVGGIYTLGCVFIAYKLQICNYLVLPKYVGHLY